MPTTRNRLNIVLFSPSELPAGLSPNACDKIYDKQDGFKRSSGDAQNIILPYDSFRSKGRMIRVATTNTSYQYKPTPISIQFPITGGYGGLVDPYRDLVKNRAYDKFKGKALGESTQLGVLLAERKKSYGMIANRVTGLYRSYRSLRKGDFRGFLRNLSVDPRRKHRNKTRAAAHEASGLWLEYWFGWSPTVKDLYNTAGVLTYQYPSEAVSGSSVMRVPRMAGGLASASVRRVCEQEGILIAKTGANVKLVNPDTQLLQQMGLLNPLSIAWELVPFSFVVDWFTKFGNVIEATTDFVGVELSNEYGTYVTKTTGTFDTARRTPSSEWLRPSNHSIYEYRTYTMKRTKGIFKPVATLPRLLNYGNSKTRAATAVSLLTTLFIAK